MNSVFWFLIGLAVGYVLFEHPQYIEEAGNWLVEQAQTLENR